MRDNKLETENRFSKIEEAGAEMRQTINTRVKRGMIEINPGLISAVVKPPTSDGQIPWAAYRQQFKSAAITNGWTAAEKATALTVSLRGQALKVLQSLQADQRTKWYFAQRTGQKYLPAYITLIDNGKQYSINIFNFISKNA